MIKEKVLFVFILGVLSVVMAQAKISDRDASYKKENLSKLKAPDFEDAGMWKEFIHIATSYRDEEVVQKIFSVMEMRLDGYFATNYLGYLGALLKTDPAFFVLQAEKKFGKNFGSLLPFIADETQEVPIDDVEKAIKKIPPHDPAYVAGQRFLKLAKKRVGKFKK